MTRKRRYAIHCPACGGPIGVEATDHGDGRFIGTGECGECGRSLVVVDGREDDPPAIDAARGALTVRIEFGEADA